MKIIVISILLTALLAACNSGSKEDSKTKEDIEDITKHPDYQKGLALVADPGSQCLNCHKIDETHTGPPYREVAKRYAGRPDTIIAHLASKIIHGGKGEWGEIFMTPNSKLSQEDAEAMVKYILLLKN